MKLAMWGCALVGVALASGASAQAVQSYLYDANGRLVGATTARAAADGDMTGWVLDDADNRATRSTYPLSPPPATGNTFQYAQALLPSQGIVSANGQYRFMFEDGDLKVEGPSGALWSSCTGEGRSMFARVEDDGRLTVHGDDFLVLWSTPTQGNPGAVLTIENSGVAVLRDAGGTQIWSSTTPCQ